MILAFDVGNTRTTVGCFELNSLLPYARVFLDKKLLSKKENIRDYVTEQFALQNLQLDKITGIIYSSVVPLLDSAFLKFFQSLDIRPIVVSIKLETGIKFSYSDPGEIGTDRIVNAVAAFSLYKNDQDLIVVDSGTAITFCVILKEGEFKGGLILPGVNICLEALEQKTAQLPKVVVKKPESVTGITTVSGIQSGIYYGFRGMFQGIISSIEREFGKRFSVILTGGMTEIFSDSLDRSFIIDPDLTLKGLKLLYDMNS